jgi:hypothetical protein
MQLVGHGSIAKDKKEGTQESNKERQREYEKTKEY